MADNRKGNKKNNMLIATLTIICIVALLLGIEYLAIVSSNRVHAYQTATVLIDHVRNILASNEEKEQSLVDSLKEDYIAKAKAVSYIIDNVPETESDLAELIRIANLMSIDEIHIFDQSGKIYGGTVPPYYGFTFDSGEQMAFFKPMLENKALSMCQDVTPNTAEGKSMMYAICWNDAGTRMTQIGIEPRRLIEEMRTNEISEVIADLPAYDGIDIVVADRDSGVILGSTVPRQVGITLAAAGLDLSARSLSEVNDFSAVISRKHFYCSAVEMGNYIIAITQERAEVNRDLPIVMLMVFLYLLLAAAAISFIVRRMTRRILQEQNNANTDPMTGFFNRRAYETDMRRHAEGPREEDLIYISIDLNGLKVVNDKYGHEAGDDLLIGAAQCIEHSFGESGKLYRIGGDEFVAIIHADEPQLEKLKQGYELSLQTWTARHGRDLTTACGYVRAAEFPDKSMTEIAKLADERMYAAKAEYYRLSGKDMRKH